ncbi:MAG TPA: efflux RND transporter periplasmic adaptor subunit [Hydrogenophaga sp.]|uniref:efflux RND transporter periplasmic adaptor subunit n=1 Tax=Hydrogenophaga sp. TaxID=1904254 RepID=UPI002BB3C904|nr:efflux RND transporter periplasmic adaptor subunit [Hydrogenophaga sp.]HMN93086.1 efflux RND transporter periplasmic adaptor subunit [Hydrogenophaga sp.]HMP10956.1 efflux RND transporter periplasmic adaptor subunit [Hydrogenophaga sp.]
MSILRAHWKFWLILSLLLLATSWGVWKALERRAEQQTAAAAAAAALQQPPVFALEPGDLATAERMTITSTAPVSGAVRALQTAAIKARVAGEVQGLRKREGHPVQAGEVLARIDPTEARARVRQAEQQAASARSQVQIARRTLDNNQALVQKGFISATALENSQANLEAAEATLQATLASLDIARKTLDDTVLRSPLAGQVSARYVQNGERVGIDTRILEVVDLSAFEIEAALSPADAALVTIGQRAVLRVEGLPEPVDGVVDRINPNVQAGSRAVLVYLRLPATPGLRQGLFARGHVVTGGQQAVAVPAATVRNDKPEPYVQAVIDDRVRHLPVRVLIEGLAGERPVTGVEGVPEATLVLRAGTGVLREGTSVSLPEAQRP